MRKKQDISEDANCSIRWQSALWKALFTPSFLPHCIFVGNGHVVQDGRHTALFRMSFLFFLPSILLSCAALARFSFLLNKM